MVKGHAPPAAQTAADTVAAIFGKLEAPKKDEPQAKIATTLAFISPAEWALALELAEKAAAGEALPKDKDLKKLVLRRAERRPERRGEQRGARRRPPCERVQAGRAGARRAGGARLARHGKHLLEAKHARVPRERAPV